MQRAVKKEIAPRKAPRNLLGAKNPVVAEQPPQDPTAKTRSIAVKFFSVL
jgi:hypothetical protein